MRVTILPGINAASFDEVLSKIKQVELLSLERPEVSWVHIDVADGSFAPVMLWNDAHELENIRTSLNIELHLMLSEIDARIQYWLRRPAHRIIVHLETVNETRAIISACHRSGMQVGFAVGPETDVSHLLPHLTQIDFAQILTVYPGKSGQEMLPDAIQKISAVAEVKAGIPIEVDGGVNKKTIGKCVHAGATHFVASSALFASSNIIESYDELIRHGIE